MGLDQGLFRAEIQEHDHIYANSMFWKNRDELIYWRKKYDLHDWFFENTNIRDEVSDIMNTSKLNLLIEFLKKEKMFEDVIKVEHLIKETDFEKQVIFYSYCN